MTLEGRSIGVQMRRGLIEYCILIMLNRHTMYANDILDQLRDKDLIATEGGIYVLLNKLRSHGYVKHHWQESKQGPPRKYYTISEMGRRHLDKMEETWHETAIILDQLRAGEFNVTEPEGPRIHVEKAREE